MKKNILILGSEGMVGRTIFRYLSSLQQHHVWGTTRKENTQNLLHFTVENYNDDFKHIKKRIKKIDYIINCIGVFNNFKSKKDLITINSLFPHLLEEISEKNNCKLIHISTDAVFSPLSGEVNEITPLSPNDLYGASKVLGETMSKNALTIRSSFIGFDPLHHKGLLEWTLQAKTINGYTKTMWTGCTSLQFTQFCNELIDKNLFQKLRSKTPVVHFAPLGPISKFQLVKTILQCSNKKTPVKKTPGEKKEIFLTSNYLDLALMSQYTNDIKKALDELISFEKSQSTYAA